ncbi:DUF6262 family protein [Streptomyces sp. NPDC002550]
MALAARRRKTEAALDRVHQAIARLRREKARVSAADLARRADVSRTVLYDNVEARAAVAAAMAQAGEHQSRTLAEQDDEREATWRERALNAEDALKAGSPTTTAPSTSDSRPPRSNLRFQDRRVADLEARIAEPAPTS